MISFAGVPAFGQQPLTLLGGSRKSHRRDFLQAVQEYTVALGQGRSAAQSGNCAAAQAAVRQLWRLFGVKVVSYRYVGKAFRQKYGASYVDEAAVQRDTQEILARCGG